MQVSENGFLGGRIMARQPVEGFRSGTDAVMLAAAVPSKAGDELLELGSGAGVASLCVAARVARCRITGAEIATDLVTVAKANAHANKLEDRVGFVQADVFKLPKHLRKEFDHVFCNPPFHESAGQISPSADRARALSDREGLANWIRVGLARVAAGGTLTIILRANRLADALQAVARHGVSIFPLWPREGEPAKRLLVQIRKNSRAPLVLFPGLALHNEDGRFTAEADAVLRGASSLDMATLRL
jgi:tRNA1Val (adenine37-N6)-methyltransferase